MSRAGAALHGFAGVVLAGGASTRMGRPKAALELGGKTFLELALEPMRRAGLAPLIVVFGVHADAIQAALPAGMAAQWVANPSPERGQLSSLKLALRHLESATDVQGAVVGLVDHPLVAESTVARLVAALDVPGSSRRYGVAVPVHAGRRGHPIALARAAWQHFLAAPDDSGARSVTRRSDLTVEVPVEDAGVTIDVDTPADLARLHASFARGG